MIGSFHCLLVGISGFPKSLTLFATSCSALKDALKNSRPSSNIISNAVTNDHQELSHHITDRSNKILIKSMMKDSLAHEGLPEEYEDEKFEDS